MRVTLMPHSLKSRGYSWTFAICGRLSGTTPPPLFRGCIRPESKGVGGASYPFDSTRVRLLHRSWPGLQKFLDRGALQKRRALPGMAWPSVQVAEEQAVATHNGRRERGRRS